MIKPGVKIGVFDLESNGLVPEATKVHCLVIKDMQNDEVHRFKGEAGDYSGFKGTINAGLDMLHNFDIICGHNAIKFDWHLLKKLYPNTTPQRKRVLDTLVLARLFEPHRAELDQELIDKGKLDKREFRVWDRSDNKFVSAVGRHSLESWGLRLGFPKDSFSHTVDWETSEWSQEMEDYCVQDVEVTAKLLKQHMKKLSEEDWGDSVQLEHDVAFIIALQEFNGFGFNRNEAIKIRDKYTAKNVELERQLQIAFPPITKTVELKTKTNTVVTEFNPGSTQQIEQRLRDKYDWKPTVFTDTGKAKIDDTILGSLEYPEAQLLAEYKKNQKKLGQLNNWLDFEKNGRIHGGVNSNGAVTGRMTHSRPNTANIDGDTDLRALWIPREGWKLVGCDADGLELRLLGHYLSRFDGGDYAKAVVYGKKEDETDAHNRTKNLATFHSRDNAKTLIYALIYGAGNAKLGSIMRKDYKEAGKLMREADGTIGGKLKSRLLRGITGFDLLTSQVKSKVKSQGWLKGLDGRRLYIRAEHAALNTLIQGAGAIIMKKALVIFHERMNGDYYHGKTFGYCGNIHDEVQLEVVSQEAKKVGQAFADCIVEAGKQLGVRVPMAGTFDIGDNWSQTH